MFFFFPVDGDLRFVFLGGSAWARLGSGGIGLRLGAVFCFGFLFRDLATVELRLDFGNYFGGEDDAPAGWVASIGVERR